MTYINFLTKDSQELSPIQAFYQNEQAIHEKFFLRDKADSDELFNDIEQAIAVVRMRGYQRLWVLTNNIQKVIDMAIAKIDFKAVRRLGITEIKIVPWTKQNELMMNLQSHLDFSRTMTQTLIIRADSHGPTLLIF